MRRVLILGVSGFLGSRLAIRWRAAHRVIGTFRTRPPRVDALTCLPFELTPDADFAGLCARTRPDVVIYATRFAEPADATWHLFFRQKLPVRLAEILALRKAEFVFFGDARLFSGTAGPYSEASEPDATDEKAIIAADGERALLALPNTRVLRLGTLMGMGREPGLDDVGHTYCSVGRVAEALEAGWASVASPRLLHVGTDDTLGGTSKYAAGALDCGLSRRALGLPPFTVRGWAEAYRRGLHTGDFET